MKLLSRVWLFVTPWTAAYQAPLPMGFSRQEYWSGLPLPSLQQTWVYTNSERQWRTGKPSVFQSVGVIKSQTRLSNWTTKVSRLEFKEVCWCQIVILGTGPGIFWAHRVYKHWLWNKTDLRLSLSSNTTQLYGLWGVFACLRDCVLIHKEGVTMVLGTSHMLVNV